MVGSRIIYCVSRETTYDRRGNPTRYTRSTLAFHRSNERLAPCTFAYDGRLALATDDRSLVQT
jgi:hypothetical protein